MKVFRSSQDAFGHFDRPAVAIGNFDGVHLGHRAIFARTRQLANGAAAQRSAVVLTFEPHPARHFRPDLAPPLITTEAQKLQLIERSGLDGVVIQPFDEAFAALTPARFVRQVLCEHLQAAHVVVGRTFVFGHDRAGNLEKLIALGEQHGFEAHGVEPVYSDGIVISSSKIREFVMMGRVEGAAALLGRTFAVTGRVVRGAGRGQTIGVPTANLAANNELIPKRGVYAGTVELVDLSNPDRGGARHPAVINVGTAPTMRTTGEMVIEAHLLDFASDLVGRPLTVAFEHRLRDERRFPSVPDLVEAIRGDIQRARELLGQ